MKTYEFDRDKKVNLIADKNKIGRILCAFNDLEYNADLEENYFVICWDDQTIEKVASVELEQVKDPLHPLEEEFKKLFEEFNPEIKDKLGMAIKIIQEVVALSDKSGLPFSFNYENPPINISYQPTIFNSKFPNFNSQIAYDITGCYTKDNAGWTPSQNC